MKIQQVENGYIVETEDLYKYVFHNKNDLLEFIDDNIVDIKGVL